MKSSCSLLDNQSSVTLQQIGTAKVDFSSNDTGCSGACHLVASPAEQGTAVELSTQYSRWRRRGATDRAARIQRRAPLGLALSHLFFVSDLCSPAKTPVGSIISSHIQYLFGKNAKNIIFPVVIHNTACTHDSQALYQGRLHTADKEKVTIENVFHLNSHHCQ